MQYGQQSALAFQLEGNLRHQHEVYFLAGQAGAGGDESRIAPHQLHDADAVQHAVRFHVRGVDNVLRLPHRSVITE